MTDDSTGSGPPGPDRPGRTQRGPERFGPDRTGPPPEASTQGASASAGGPTSPGGGAAPGGSAEPRAAGVGSGDEPGRAPAPLMRSRRHRVVAGVCGGLGRYFDTDPVIFRIVLAVLALTGGVGLLVYGIAWLFIPVQGESSNEAQRLLSGRVEVPGIAAVLACLAGCAVFLTTIGSEGGRPFPLFVIGAALGAIYWAQRRRGSAAPPWASRAAAAPVPPAPPAAGPPPPSFGTPSWWKDADTGAGGGPPPYLWGPDDDPAGGAPVPAGSARPREPRSRLAFTAFCLAVAAAVTGAALARTSALGTTLQVGFACALAVFGFALVVGSLFGKARGGTVLLALLTTVLLAGSVALPDDVTRDWQERSWRPKTAADVQPVYELGTGRGVLDLTGLDPKGRTVRVRAEMGAGLLEVRVPTNVRVEGAARAELGMVRVPGYYRSDDIDFSVHASRETVFEPSGPADEQRKGTVRLDVEIGIGQVEVSSEAP